MPNLNSRFFSLFFHISVNHSSRACVSCHPARVASDDDEDDQDDDYRVFGRMTMKAQSEVGAPSSRDTRTGTHPLTHSQTHTHDRNVSRKKKRLRRGRSVACGEKHPGAKALYEVTQENGDAIKIKNKNTAGASAAKAKPSPPPMLSPTKE